MNDPSAPEWAEQGAWFTRQWKRVIELAAAAGTDEMVVVPEYGPPPYQAVHPHGGGPVGDLWAMCCAERDRLHDPVEAPVGVAGRHHADEDADRDEHADGDQYADDHANGYADVHTD